MSGRARRGPASSGGSDEPASRLRDPRHSRSLECGLAILGVFTPARPLLGISQIAEEVGMSPSTTHRYVITLVALGYLEQGASRKYRLGLRVTDLGMAALNSTDLRSQAQPYLVELRERTSYTVGLGVLDGGDVLYLDCVRSFSHGQEAGLQLGPGSRVPVYCTAVGKLLLANLPGPEQYGVISATRRARRGPNTITSQKALREELLETRLAGFAVSDQEFAAEIFEIAAPVRNDAGEVVAAVNMAAHSSRISLEELVNGLGPQRLGTAERISARPAHNLDEECSAR
jgi:IclR family transcriptional regulator, pca regulon regulatory protein